LIFLNIFLKSNRKSVFYTNLYLYLQKQQIMPDTFTLPFVHTISGTHSSVAYTTNISEVRRSTTSSSNGFGIVSTSNIAPASKERIDRLLAFLEKLRDDALAIVLTMLPDAHHWTSSRQYDYFAATMFPTLDIVTSLGYSDHIWQRYQDLHTQLLTIENRLASDFFSHELMTALRTLNILSQWDISSDSAHYRRIYQRIAAIEFSVLRIGEYPMPSITDTVNIIRTAKGNLFSEWKQSDTAKLFENHGYKNKKQSSGYFF